MCGRISTAGLSQATLSAYFGLMQAAPFERRYNIAPSLMEMLKLTHLDKLFLIKPDQASAVRAIKAGATDFILKPWQNDKLVATLATLKARHGFALLWDAHSIESRVPRLFDGELPVLNVGTFNGTSCDEAIATAVMQAADDSPYDAVRDRRFKGGHITRHYGDPGNGVQAMQLELAQRAYMDEATNDYDDVKASQLADTLRAMLAGFTMRA